MESFTKDKGDSKIMEIIFKAYHGIDVENKQIEQRDITEDFNKIIQEMLSKIMNNPSVKRYKTETERAVIASIIKDVTYAAEDKQEGGYEQYADEIATRLLKVEVRVQQRMEHLNGVQKGSLIQALVKSESGQYKYLIAKVEHTNYVDEVELVLKGGFNPEENKIWKTCIFSCEKNDDGFDVSEAKIFLNHMAVYWTDDFLDLVEMKSDEKNTKDAWKSIETVLKNELKKYATSDYFVLRNAVINYFRRPKNIDYYEMLDNIFSDYHPIDIDAKKVQEIKVKLERLPNEKNFDSNFISKPKEVKARIKSVHKVNNDIDVIIRAGINEEPDNFKDVIYIQREKDGSSWLVINATDPDTLKAFDIRR